MKKPACILCTALFLSALPARIYARQPILERRTVSHQSTDNQHALYADAQSIGDPTFSALSVHGAIESPGETDVYVFSPRNGETFPVTLLIPAKPRNAVFAPALIIVGQSLPVFGLSPPVPFMVPLGLETLQVPSPPVQERSASFDAWSLERVYRGETVDIPAIPKSVYYLIVHEEHGNTGSYILTLGSKTNFSQSVLDTVPNVDPATIVFAGSIDRRMHRETPPSQYERSLFPEKLTAFQSLDSRLKLWGTFIDFFIYRFVSFFV